ncbi:MAG: TlpA family protein disulfide reductase [Gammaproteobacteria bacterium]|nr:TlpA family protein disulfide reductase [Gammaproteobacteria bacterium]
MRYIFGIFLFVSVSYSYAAQTAPAFDLPTDNGKVSLKSLKNQVVYVDFWATWCTPCRKSFPWMNDMQKKYKNNGLKIVAINLDEDKKNIARFLQKYPANFTIAFDPDGKSAEAYGVSAMPSSYLVDKKGKLIKKHAGFREKDQEALEKEFRKALGL